MLKTDKDPPPTIDSAQAAPIIAGVIAVACNHIGGIIFSIFFFLLFLSAFSCFTGFVEVSIVLDSVNSVKTFASSS